MERLVLTPHRLVPFTGLRYAYVVIGGRDVSVRWEWNAQQGFRVYSDRRKGNNRLKRFPSDLKEHAVAVLTELIPQFGYSQEETTEFIKNLSYIT